MMMSLGVLGLAIAAVGFTTTAATAAGKCTFANDTGFEKAKQVPGHRNDAAATPQVRHPPH